MNKHRNVVCIIYEDNIQRINQHPYLDLKKALTA